MIYLGNSPVGVAVGVGEFTQYEKVSLTFPNADNDNAWSKGAIVPCSFKPKVVVFYGGTKAIGNLISGGGVMNYDSKLETDGGYCGQIGIFQGNAGNNQFQVQTWKVYDMDETNHTTGMQKCQYYDGNFYISRYGNGTYWSSTDTYTFEFYG